MLVSLFIRETFGRFFKKSPKFFVIWQIILGGIFAVVEFLPGIINTILEQAGMTPIDLSAGVIGHYLGLISAGAAFALQFTVQAVPELDHEDKLYTSIDSEKLPFTASVIQKSINNQNQ